MSKTRAERAAALEAWADRVDSDELVTADTDALRVIAELAEQRDGVDAALVEAVRAARRHDRRGNRTDDTRRVDPVRDVLTCSPDTTIRKAAALMSERNVGSILVVDEERRPLGIVTDSDLRSKVVGEGRA